MPTSTKRDYRLELSLPVGPAGPGLGLNVQYSGQAQAIYFGTFNRWGGLGPSGKEPKPSPGE